MSQFANLFSVNKHFTFLIGAGISMDPPSSLPSARSIVKTLIEYCAPPDEIPNLLAIPALRYEQVVEKVKLFFDMSLEFMDYFDLSPNPNRIHQFLAHNIVLGNYVMTTNFDSLIERALLQIVPKINEQDIMPIITKEDFTNYTDPLALYKINKKPLYKIHGAPKNIITKQDTKKSLITTMKMLGKDRGTEDTFSIEAYKRPAVSNLLRNRILIIMGYSGSDDFDISPLLQTFPDLVGLIWIDHTNQQETELENIQRLQELVKNSKDLESNRIERLLLELHNRFNYEIYLIRANTGNFIQNILWPIFFPKENLPSLANQANIPPFKDWTKSVIQVLVEANRYCFAADLYSDLGKLDNAEKVIKNGLQFIEKKYGSQNTSVAKSWLLNQLGIINQDRGNFDQALRIYQELVPFHTQSKDWKNLTSVLSNIALIYKDRGQFRESLQYYEKVMQLIKTKSGIEEQGPIYNNIGETYRMIGQYDQAFQYYEEGLVLINKTGDLTTKSIILNNIGLIFQARGDYSKALQYYQDSIRINELMSDLKGISISLNNIGTVYRLQKKYDDALTNYEKALKIDIQFNNLKGMSIRLNNIGKIYEIQKKYDLAIQNYFHAFQTFEQIHDLPDQAAILSNIGIIYYFQDQYSKALEFFQKSMQIAVNIGDIDRQGVVYANLGFLYLKEKRYPESIQNFEKAIAITDKLRIFNEKAIYLHGMGVGYRESHQYESAQKMFTQAITLFQQYNMLDELKKAQDDLKKIQ